MNIHEGWLTKLGSFRKNWNRRWFVVRADYSIAYFANETDQRPKGEMILQSYKVRTDCQKVRGTHGHSSSNVLP